MQYHAILKERITIPTRKGTIMEDFLKIGLIQTNINKHIAWEDGRIKMARSCQIDAWNQIHDGFKHFQKQNSKPSIIVLPELSVPLRYKKQLINLSKLTGIATIAGLDFQTENDDHIKNQGIFIVPNNWPNSTKSYKASTINFGKRILSHEETKHMESCSKKGYKYPYIPIFHCGPLGYIGIAICSDIFDIERFILYRGLIHHFIILAYNKDANTFYHFAETIARLVYCNVIICNTGYYGDSIVVSPYKEAYDRTIYRHQGQQLASCQTVSVPVHNLDQAQSSRHASFKSKPPGYVKSTWQTPHTIQKGITYDI